jgi:hypothetical protein
LLDKRLIKACFIGLLLLLFFHLVWRNYAKVALTDSADFATV